MANFMANDDGNVQSVAASISGMPFKFETAAWSSDAVPR